MEDKKPVSSDKWSEALYETLKLNNAYDKDYDTFYNDFYAPGIKGYAYRKDVYDFMKKGGVDLGATYEEFASKIGLHAIDPQTQQTPMGADSISKDMKPVEVTPTKKPEAKKEEKPEVSTEAVSGNQSATDTPQNLESNVSRMRNAGTNYFLQAAEEISNNAYSKSLEELANQAAKDLKKKAYQKPKEDSYVRLNQTARYIPIRSLPKDADLDSVFEAALTFENQVCGGAKEYTFASLGGDIQERYEKWKALKGLGSSYTQETASMSPNAVYLQAINLQALGKERPAWISELRWNEALNYDKNKLNKITAELEQEDQKRRLKRSDGAYPDDVSLNGMYHANYTALMASDIYNNGTNKTIFVLFQDGRIRPLQAPDPSILRGGVEAQRELFRRQYEKMTFGEEGKEGYTDPYEKNRVVGNFLQNGEVCHIIYFPYMIEQRRWDDAQELIKIGLGGKFNEEGVLLNPDDRLQIVPVVVKNGESEEDAIAKAKVELDNEISKKLPYKETYLQQQIAQAREALKKEQERLKQLGDHDAVKGSFFPRMYNPRYYKDLLESTTEEGVKRSDEVALARGNIRKLEESIKKYTQALEALRTGDKVGAWGGFLEGISDLDNWTFGLYNLRENLVAVKAHEGKMGQEAKDRLGLARSLSQESMSAFHRHGEGRFYGPAFGAGYSFPFTIGAIATYGAGNVAARGIIRGGSRMAAKYGTNWLFDTTIRATTRLAAINAAGVIDSSFQMPRIISDAAIEKMGLMNYTFDENQRIVVTGTQQEKSWGHSLLHAGLNTLKENVSERVGTYVLTPVAKAFGIGKINLRSFGEALPYGKTIHMIQNGAFAKAMSKVYGTFEKGGYDGFVNEVLEEYIANPMTATFDENYTFADIFDSRQNLDTALSVWASSILMLGLSSTASSVKYYRTLRSVNSAYDKAEANARRLFGNENWDKIQNTILRLEGEPLVNAIYAGVCQNKSLSDEQKKAFLNYVRAQKAQAVFNNAVSEKYSFSLTGEELNEMNAMTIHAYAEGRNMQTPQEYAQAQQAFADTREMAMSALGVTDDIDAHLDTLGETPAEQLKKGVEAAKEKGLDEKAANAALSAYLNAREQQKGALDAITTDESIRRQHADNVIRQITFENEADSEGGSGKIILVNVKGKEKPVYLIRGRYENGSITGETVVISEGNGVIEMIPASEVEGIVGESDAMTERQREYDKIDAKNKEQQRLINLNMDTPLAGQGGILMDEEGHRRQVGIKCVYNDEQGNPASVLVIDQNNNDYLIPIDVFREQRGRGRKFEAIEPYLDETDEEYHAAEGPMNEEYILANKEQEGVSEENAQGAAEGATPQSTTDATEKPTKPEVKYDYHVKMKDVGGNAVSGRVTNLTADGVEIEFDAPYNGKMVDRIPLADFDSGVSEIADANGNVLWNETEAVGDTEVAPQVDAAPTQVGQEDAEKPAIDQTAQEEIDESEEARQARISSSEYKYDKEMRVYGHTGHLYDYRNGVAIYLDEEGNPLIYLAAQNDNTYIGLFRDDSGMWSTKMENSSNDKTVFKGLISAVMDMLPEGAKFYEHSNVSVDGLRVFAQQLNHGFKVSDETYECGLNGEDKANVLGSKFKGNGEFVSIEHATEADLEHLKGVLKPYMEALGRTTDDIRLGEDGKVLLTLPILIKEGTNTKTGEDVSASDVSNTQKKTTQPVHESAPDEVDTKPAGTQDEAHKPTALERIPKDENGNPIYEQTDAETAFAALAEQAGNAIDAGEIAKSMVKDKSNALEKAKGIKLPTGVSVVEKIAATKARNEAIARAQEELDKWKAIADVPVQQIARVIEGQIAQEKAEAEAEARRKKTTQSTATTSPVEGNTKSAKAQEETHKPTKMERVSANDTAANVSSLNKAESENENSNDEVNNEIPRDKDGNLIYEQAPLSATVTSLYDGSLNDAEIDDFIAANIAEAGKAVEKLGKRKPKIGINKAKYLAEKKAWETQMQEAKRRVQYWNDVKSEVERITTPDDARGWKDELSGKTAKESYLKHGQSKDGAQSEMELIAEFMQSSGAKITPESYRKETGFGVSEQRAMIGKISKKGKSIDRLAEELATYDGEYYNGSFFDGDSMLAKNAIINYLSSEYSRKGIGRMQSESEKEYIRAYEEDRDRFFQEKYHMSYEEYLAFSAQELPNLLRKYSNFDEQQFYILYAEDIEADLKRREKQFKHQEDGTERNDSEGEEPRHDRGNQIQSGQRVDDNRRGEVGKDSEGENRPRHEGVNESGAAFEEPEERVTNTLEESSPSPQENGPKNSTQSAIESASAEVETSPSEAQKKAGNYKMGHVKVGAFDVTIENPKGSERSGTDANGKKWSVKMNNTYGYIRGTEGVDGDHIDVFLAEDMDKWDGKYVFVVDQYNPDGTFDEHKVMLGFNSMEEARSAYLSNYEKGWENGRRIVVARIKADGFQKWVDSSHRKTKPFANYVIAGESDVSDNKKKSSASKKGKPRVSKKDEVKRTVEHFPMETPEEAAAFDKRIPEMEDSELLAYMQEDGKGDVNKAYHMNVYDEYDYRHTDEQTEAYNIYIQQLHDSNTTLEQAEEMLGNILGDNERFATDERSQLIGQSDALQDYITELERQKENERAKAENSAENTDANHVEEADVAENKSAEPVEADKSKQYGEYQEVYDNFVSDVENRGMIPDLGAIKNKIRDTKRRLTVLRNGAATSIQSDEDLKRFETAEKKQTDLLHTYEAMRDYTEARVREAEAAAQRKPWIEKNAQERMDEASKNPLTKEEIQNAPTDEVNKANALDYLSGNHGLIQGISYLKVYEDVRNPNGSAASDSGTKDKTQLAGRSNSASEKRDTGGKSGGTAGRVDNGGGREDVSEQSDGGKSGEGSTRDNAGEGSNTGIPTEEQPMGRRAVNSGKPRRGGTSGRTRSDGGRSGRGESGNPATENGTRRAASESVKEESADDFLNQALGEFKDVLDDFIKAGRGELSISLVGLNSKQMEMLPRLIQVGAKVGYAYIRKGVHSFTEWANHVKEAIGKYLRDANLSDDEIDAFIKEMWKSKIPFDGQIHTLEEWASIYSKKELRNKVKTTIEEKREAQRRAEGISVKTGDINNIRETLPFLLPQQQEDVLRAETQFFGKSHQDREHANGKGYMFTNGTGTGKTYTGLGIVKRFVKQGKKRILILTPSQPKVRDWINDGKNLGLEIKSLDDWAKERGTTATTEAGEGTIITTYANFRQNEELLNGTFDLIVYDESHRLMENKNAANTIGTDQHHMIANRDISQATVRLRKINPIYQELNKVHEEFMAKRENLVKKFEKEDPLVSEGLLASQGLIPYSSNVDNWNEKDAERFPEFAKLRKRYLELREIIVKEVDPQIEEQAKKDAAHTKVVFLSATPFNTRENIDYAQGYIFSYPDKEQARGYSVASPQTIFFEEHFGAAYKWRYGRLEHSERNAEAIAQQEREFSDWLQHTLCTMSGRIIDSEYDYSRDFPVVSVEHAEEINNAAEEILRDKYFNMAYHKVFGNYNYAGALFETLKVATLIPRIKQHLEAGRKVVIFHRRVESKTPLIPPFAAMLSACHAIIDGMKMENKPKEEIDAARHRLEELKEKWRGLLKWESMLDYSMPREQIAKAFGADNVLYFSGQESTKAKNQAVDSFNNDESGKNIIVIQEASGKEGISLHDTTGKHQRVLITLALPQSPITALQIEGRIYRIGNRSNAIFEYPLLGLNSEIILFGQKFNGQIGTTENLALGSQARNLRESFARSVEESGKDVPIEEQGFGGKEADAAERGETSPFDRAVLDYYGNQKLKGKRDSREGVDYYPTPEPLGFKMVEWGNLNDGETALEPSAGHGAIARYVPSANPLTAIEPSQNLFAKLQLKAGGSGRKFVNTIFEGYNVVNKHDVIFMNPPFGTGGRLAVDHVAKAFTHLTEGGRIVAIIPRGSTDKKFDKWIDEQENAVVTGEIMLPDITFQQAGTSVMARVLVIDKVTNQELRDKAESKYRRVDLSRRQYDKIEDFFEDIRDIQMPSRTIDEKARMLKRAAPALRDIKELKGVVDVQAQEDGIDIRTKGSAMGFYLDLTVSDFSLQQQLRAKYQRYAQEIEWNEHRHNEKAVEIYKAYNDLVCRLLGKTAEEVESDITREKMGLEQPHEEKEAAINVAPKVEESPSSEQNESTTESSPYHYELKHHTKTGAEMFMAMPNEKSGLSSEEYSSMLAKAKKYGGYWNRFMKGFAFPSEKSAKDFLAETGNTQPQADERYQKTGTPLTPNSAEVALRDAIADLMRKSGLDVIDSKEGQQVLDEANRDELRMSLNDNREYEGKSSKERSDIQYKKAKELLSALREAGFKGFEISRSITPFGVSTYIQGDLGLKFRISDHDVSSFGRIFGEEHIGLNTSPDYVVLLANGRKKDINIQAEKYKKESAVREERERRANEKWNRIKANFEGMVFKRNDRTYQDYDTFSNTMSTNRQNGHKYQRRYVMQTAIGKSGADTDYRYEWAEPADIDEYGVATNIGSDRPSLEFIEAYDEPDTAPIIREQRLTNTRLYNPRASISPVRGQWTKDKILRRLKDIGGSRKGFYTAAKFISEFDSPEELEAHMYYHGTQYGVGALKPSILMSDRDIERYGGGGYGVKYWGISVSKSKKIASNFSIGEGVKIYPIILCKSAKVVEVNGVKDAEDLDEYIEQLWKDGVDAVWIGEGEQELCVLNPLAIVNIDRADYYRYYKLGSEENPLKIIDKEGIAKLYHDAKAYIQAYKKSPRKPLRPSLFEESNNGEFEYKPKDKYEAEMREYEQKMDEYLNSDEYREWEKAREYAEKNIRFFRTSNGEAYGFTVGGKIYIDPRIATAETPIHEYAHLWATAMREGNPTEWKNIVGLMKGTSVWAEVQKLYPELKNDDDIADEVLATFSGRRGAERLRAEQQKIMQGNGSVFEKAAAVGALARVKQALSKFWKGVADFLGIHYTSAEEVADRVMKDLLEGVDPRKFGVSGVLRESIRLPKDEYAKVAHAIATNTGLKKAGMNEVFTDNNYYIYTAKKNGDFTVRFGLPIEGNEDVINELSKGIKDGAIRNTRSLHSVVEGMRGERNKDYGNNADVEGRYRSSKGTGDLALRQKADSAGSDGYLGEELSGRTPTGNSDRGAGRGRVDDTSYRQGEETSHTTSSESKTQAAQKATENLNLGGNVVVHESAEGLEGKEATAKGWYDTKTGQIHVVLSNNADAADVTQTILHEAVAHHGLRELFGHNVMDAFLDSVFAAASQEVKDAINELRRGKGWNFRTATEEYLAGLAERTDFERMTAEKRGLFATLRRLFNRALEFLGLKNRELSDRELAYILWCSYQNLKAGEKGRYVAEAERIAMRYKLKAGKNAMTDTEKKEHSVLLRGELDNLQEILAKDTYERLVTSGSHLERTAWVDMLSPLQDLQHAIEKNGGFKLGDFENPYNAYITMSSRNYAQMDIYKRTLYADMIEAIHALGSETGRSYEEIKTYVMAKHGMERQKYMAGKAAEEAYDRYKSMHPFGQKTLDYFIDEYEEKSFAGLTELFGTQSVSDAMDEAQKYVDEVEADAGSLADSLWDSIRDATKSSLQRAYEAGLISKETYDNVSSMYQYYIPLRGFDETTSDEVYEYFGDQTINGGTGSFMKKAKGRKSVADDPFAVIGNMAEMAIMQSNRNLMKQQLLNLALNHPSDLISVSDLYVKFDEDYDNGDGTRGAWVPVAVPDTSGMTTEEANQVMLDFQDDMEEKVKAEPDTYALAHQKPHIPYRVLGRNMNEHQVMVKRGGKTYILTINGNPRAAQAINGLLNPDATENPGAIALKAMTNWIARMATARNVEFAISNAMRDLEFSTTLIPKEGTEYYGRYVKNYLTCVKNIGRLVNRLNGNTLDMSNPLEKAFYDFIYNGGETGYTFMRGVERYKGEITKALSELRAKEGKSKIERLGNKVVYGHHYIINDAWNIYMKGAEYLSRCTEDWVRFAVFLTSRQMGRSMEQSIMDAKEVTVNFNRKGAGSKSAGKWDVSNFFSMNNLHFLSAYAASAFKNFYAFSNASIQGLDKNVRLHLNHTAGMLMWDGAAVTLGMLSAMCIPLMLSAIGGDPDDYWDMPESMRRMGIMLPLGKDGRFLTLPMSIEHRAAYGIGELLGTVVCGSENLPASEITFQAFEQLSQILPLDLTEGNGSMLSLVPTAVRPEVEIAFNKNWLGMPIYKEPFNKNTPAFRNVYQSTNPNYIAMSKWLNEVQGGGDYERAGVQVNPAMVQHLVESYTGGAGKFVSRTSGVIAKIIQGEQIRSNEIPFYRTLVKSVDDRTHNRAARERFQREYDKGQKLIYKIDNYQKESARGNSQYVKELDEFAKSKDFMSYMLWKSYNSVKSQFDNARSYIGDDKDKRAALDHAQMLVQKMMTECARAVENSKTQEEADEKIGRIQSEYTPQIKETLSKVEE
nr:MAG TPA: Type I restriction enzyme [Caudoviricetes sp.]